MAKCKKCGSDMAIKSNHLCYRCLMNWQAKRLHTFEQAQKELGKLNPENLEKIKQRVKQLEKF